jgi:acetyl-CoA acyltransferase 1
MGIGPIAAIPKVLAQVGISKEDVDVYEVITVCLGPNA